MRDGDVVFRKDGIGLNLYTGHARLWPFEGLWTVWGRESRWILGRYFQDVIVASSKPFASPTTAFAGPVSYSYISKYGINPAYSSPSANSARPALEFKYSFLCPSVLASGQTAQRH
jgi:hypothetical protein